MHKLVRTLILTTLLASRTVVAQTTGTARSPAASTIGQVASSLSPDLRSIPRAPIGHRQPKVTDVPSENPAGLDRLDEEDRVVDRKLTICRGC